MQSNSEKIIVGAALTLAVSVLIPIARTTLAPLAAGGVQSARGLAERAKYALQVARDEVEDIIAEAQFERMKKRIDREIGLPGPGAEAGDEDLPAGLPGRSG